MFACGLLASVGYAVPGQPGGKRGRIGRAGHTAQTGRLEIS